MEGLVWIVPVATLVLGLIIGWLGQRTGFCSIGGIRDFILFRQTRLLKGFIALIVSAFVFYLLGWLLCPAAYGDFFFVINKGFAAIGGAPAGISITATVICMIVGGIVVGILGTLLGGCPLRQLVMTSEGNVKSGFFFIGLLIGAVVFSAFFVGGPELVKSFFTLLGI
ncbi:MAG TPA: YeeE/YedE thiosulfate transporter family protein [Methanocorpusculum sp.]|nr:YeeE/YedE thiosulfate transporter family protein [Methanocorpusculum sp.]